MNTPNNKRRKESIRRIGTAFIGLLQTKELNQISVTDICKLAQINRTTFYANYEDIYALAAAVQDHLYNEVLRLYHVEWDQKQGSHDFLKLFQHIYDNQLLYLTYFKLSPDGKLRVFGYDTEEATARFGNQHIDYHIEFFGQGFNAVIKKWLHSGCKESPEEMVSIIEAEYRR